MLNLKHNGVSLLTVQYLKKWFQITNKRRVLTSYRGNRVKDIVVALWHLKVLRDNCVTPVKKCKRFSNPNVKPLITRAHHQTFVVLHKSSFTLLQFLVPSLLL